MSGIELRKSRFFNRRDKLIISALDHVMEYGDQPGIENSETAIRNCLSTDALLLSRYMLKRFGHLMRGNDAPIPVVRINWSSSFYYPLSYNGGFTQIATTVEDAVQAGGEAVICSLFLENNNEQMETENVALFSEVVRQKEKLGIPLIGECYVVEHESLTANELHSKVKRVTRVMAELGADMIKCFFTGDTFREIVDNLPVPVFTIGADKLDTDLAVLQKAEESIRRGADGIIFGRNIFMAKNPKSLVEALNAVMNDGIDSKTAADKYQLT